MRSALVLAPAREVRVWVGVGVGTDSLAGGAGVVVGAEEGVAK
jgi:hypothetical protein